ncbi:unnamed protein product, partial [Rhizoctonia solani]
SLQLSQHLFSVQMAVYRTAYPLSILPGDNTYTPPPLPTHIPITLEPVVGSPSNDQINAAQDAMRIIESRGCGPLFDPNLNAQLSQHLFNLQFARYIQDSTLGRFASKPGEPHPRPAKPTVPRLVKPELTRSPVPAAPNIPRSLDPEQGRAESRITLAISQLGQSINNITELLGDSKAVLENMNRVLIATQRNQMMIGKWDKHNYAHCNPINNQGVTAIESGLPRLRYSYYRRDYYLSGHLTSSQLAGYLKFFDIGADLIQGGGTPRLKDGTEDQARALIFKHLGFIY